jgi:hypothetical protein
MGKTYRNQLPGGGPWRILSQCPSNMHNSVHAFHGHPRRCVCPRTLALRPVAWGQLPGGGPWRILSQCPSGVHNTLRGAMRSNRCICPRSIMFRTQESRLPGRGPWKVDDDCPQVSHNTVSAAMGRCGNRKQCTCPRGLALKPIGLAQMNEYWRERGRVRKSKPRREPVVIPPHPPLPSREEIERERASRIEHKQVKRREGVMFSLMRSKPVTSPQPDLSAGACRAAGAEFGEGADTKLTHVAIDARLSDRTVCESCPLKAARACRAWVLAQESPAGSWPGVWGGLDQWQRVGQEVIRDSKGRIDVIDFKIGGDSDFANPF